MVQTLKLTTSSILNQIVERILGLSDYFIYRKKVTLSEGVLFWLTASRFLWYANFGVEGGVIGSLFSTPIWVVIFGTLTLVHAAGMFAHGAATRAIVCGVGGVLWLFLTSLAIISGTNSPAAPTFLGLSLLSLLLAVRLWNETGVR